MIPDYDDYYSLTAYARRFIKTPMREVEGWLSQRSTVAMITDWERRNGNDSFRESSVPYLFALPSPHVRAWQWMEKR